jgi:hypothetical protein
MNAMSISSRLDVLGAAFAFMFIAAIVLGAF